MKRRVSAGIAALLLIASLSACIYGAVTGEMSTVHRKAAGICMECIGLG